MSYILEALKKAEAERRSGTVQTAHLPHSFAAPRGNDSMWRKPWLWTLLPAALAAAGIAAWMARTPASSAPPAPVVAPAAPAAPPAAATPVPPPLAAVAEDRLATEKPKEKPVKKPAEKKHVAEPKQTKTAKAAVEPAVGTMRDLPEAIQRELPLLEIGGYIYSGNKADRSVLINKRLLREGDEVAPGLRLEQMLPNGMILDYKGYRFRTSY
jgi:general secretion pathway protein B